MDRALEESSQDQQRLLEVSRERDEAENLQQETETEYRSLLFDSHRQINDLREHTGNLQRKLAVAEDKQAAQLAKQSTSYGYVQLQSRLENAQVEIKTLKQNVRALEKSLSSPARRLSARAQPKMLPAVSNNTESIRLKGELAQAKAEIRLLKGQVEAHQALPASSAQTSLAVANRSIEHLNSENRRLSKECMEAIELARQWEDYSRRLARQVGGQSTLQEQTEGGKPGFLKSALTTIGMLGTGVVLGAGAAAMLGREESPEVPWPSTRAESPWPKAPTIVTAEVKFLTRNMTPIPSRCRRLRSHDGRILKKESLPRLSIPDGNEVSAERQSRRKEIGRETPYNQWKRRGLISTQ